MFYDVTVISSMS